MASLWPPRVAAFNTAAAYKPSTRRALISVYVMYVMADRPTSTDTRAAALLLLGLLFFSSYYYYFF